MNKIGNNFFSVSFDLILTDKLLPYDIYINSSATIHREKFVRIYPRNEVLTNEDLKIFKKKYYQLYVNENQRDLYLKSLIQNKIPFIIEDGQMFLPFIGLDFKKAEESLK